MIRATLAFVAACLSAAAFGQVIWDENVQGDLSNDRLAPTSLTLGVGDNILIANMGWEDKDYVHFHLGPSMALERIVVVSYVSDDPISFIGVQAGTVFTEPATGTNVANLLGYALWGAADIGTDILPRIGQGPGAIGFTPPLTGTDYTFWIQQTGDPTAYRLNFVTTPEPASLSLGIGLAAYFLRAIRRRR